MCGLGRCPGVLVSFQGCSELVCGIRTGAAQRGMPLRLTRNAWATPARCTYSGSLWSASMRSATSVPLSISALCQSAYCHNLWTTPSSTHSTLTRVTRP